MAYARVFLLEISMTNIIEYRFKNKLYKLKKEKVLEILAALENNNEFYADDSEIVFYLKKYNLISEYFLSSINEK